MEVFDWLEEERVPQRWRTRRAPSANPLKKIISRLKTITVIDNWDETLPKEGIRETLDSWILQQKLNARAFGQEQVQEELQQFIDDVPQSYQEKHEYVR